MEARQCFGIALVILDEPAEARSPCEGSFDNPAARQQNETTFGFGQFDDLEIDAVPGRCLGGGLTGVPLIDPSWRRRFQAEFASSAETRPSR